MIHLFLLLTGLVSYRQHGEVHGVVFPVLVNKLLDAGTDARLLFHSELLRRQLCRHDVDASGVHHCPHTVVGDDLLCNPTVVGCE